MLTSWFEAGVILCKAICVENSVYIFEKKIQNWDSSEFV